ncbi:heterokaryon incompatibility protein [Rutstroemia sp. NJR-2017a WRK4]|nr:heterokaryon incompatibility protein [Rutstroemia sp. NJR-2017a WRK4]
MASIYENAYVVLIASNAADSLGGLWNAEWDDYGQSDGIKEFVYVNDDGSTSQIIARDRLMHTDNIPESYLEYEAPSPLSKRAWTLQEELLDSRCVFFTGKELLWKCQTTQKCECMQEDKEFDGDGQRLWDRAKDVHSPKRFGEWRSLMAYYSKRNITYEKDRLPAISGMAQHMQSKGAGEYLAGIWKRDIWESLLWLPRPMFPYYVNDNLKSTYRKRASPYRAPTWSWISLDNNYGEGNTRPGCSGLNDWQEGNYWYLEKTRAKVIDTYCEPAGVDSTGAVKSGYIILQSKCLEAWVMWESRLSQIFCGKVPLNAHWDIDLEIGLKQKVFCILIGDSIREEIKDEIIGSRRPVRGLVLRRSKVVAGTFERVGLFDGDNMPEKLDLYHMFGAAKEAVVTII